MIRIALCDDSLDELTHIQNLMDKWDHLHISLECFSDGDALIQSHFTEPFDIILLDVIMPLISGIDTAREIRLKDKDVKIVFLTSSIEYAYDSYSVKASNYLLKPVDEKKLFECLNELCQEIESVSQTIFITSNNMTHRIVLDDIEVLEAQNKHVLFIQRDGRQILSNDPLYSFEPLLLNEGSFYKPHRSYLINLSLISSYSAKEIVMRSGYRIPLSRNLHKEFENIYFSFLFRKAGERR